MSENQMYKEQVEEMSFRELIDIILNGRKLTAIITLISLLAAIILNFLVIKPTYEATAVLLTADVQVGATSIENINNVIDSYNKYPEMTVQTYLEQVKSPEVLIGVINKLNLKNNDNEKISVQVLSDMIKVSNAEDTNLINIKVSHKEPEKAASIANAIGESFIRFITENVRKRSMAAAGLIEEQLHIEEQNIAIATKHITKYLAESGNLNEMKNEMKAITAQITTFKTQLNNVENSIVIESETLEKLKQSGMENNIDLKDIKLNVNENGLDIDIPVGGNNQIENAVISIKVANLETDLVGNISRKKVLKSSIDQLMGELIALQTKIAEEEYTYNAIQRDLSLANQAYNAYKERHKEAILTAATDLGSTSVVFSSSAIMPTSPVSPRKIINILLGIVVGIITGLTSTLIRHYWRITSREMSSNKRAEL